MKNEVNIAFLGDFMPGGVTTGNTEFYSQELKSILSECDIRVATLECAIGEGLEFDKEKMDREDWRNIIYSPDRDLTKLKEINIDVVSLANNHTFDLGELGLINTIEQLDKLGIKHFGAGRNYNETISPAIIERCGKTFCFLGYMPWWWEAPHPSNEYSDCPGINQFDIDNVVSDIIKFKHLYDYVFVLPHWGLEYTYFPTDRERCFVKKMIEAGVDGIIGSHTHQVQPTLMIKSVPVCYSLGNFFFPDFYIQPPRPIWYPSNDDDIKNIPCCYEYPEKTDCYVKRVWPLKSRLGNVLIINITNKIKMSLKTVSLSENNILEICNMPLIAKIKLKIIGLALRTSLYKYFLSIIIRLKRVI